MSRKAGQSHLDEMKIRMLEERGGDPNKRGNPENPYRYQLPKKAKKKTKSKTKKA
jgi:hypothetical protein